MSTESEPGTMTSGEADRWVAFVSNRGVASPASDLILHSWERSQEAGISPYEQPRFRRVTDAELRARQAANQRLVSLATPHLEWLTLAFSDVRHAVYLVDTDGIVLASRGDTQIIADCRLSPGFDWSESQMGTNGA